MSLKNHIKNVLTVLQPIKNWDTVYWLVDVHGVIIPSSFHRKNDFRFIHSDAMEVMQWISKRVDQTLILWTSSYKEEIDELVVWLKNNSINVNFVNETPTEKQMEYAIFDKKPYYNILLDDKAGFNPKYDWTIIKNLLIDIKEWDMI